MLLITGHYGGVEFLPGYLSANDIPVSIIVKFATKHLRETATRKARAFSIETIDAEHTPNIAKTIFNHLKANRVVITQCDEIDEWRPSAGDHISFLGCLIGMDRTINILARRRQTEIVFGLMHRNWAHRYRFVAVTEADMLLRTQNSQRFSIGKAALKYLEQQIFAHPYEWYQWSKFTALQTMVVNQVRAQHLPAPMPLLHPSMG